MKVKVNPVVWANNFAKTQGWPTAEAIVANLKKDRIGKDGCEANPHASFYKRAYEQLLKIKPAE